MKAIIYDSDGMLTHGGRFSDAYVEEFGIDPALMKPFFDGPFKRCILGQADLKEELQKVLLEWRWTGSAESLTHYWFAVGDELDQDIYDSVVALRKQGLVVALATNQEQHRMEYLTKKFSYDTVFDEIFCSSRLGCLKHSAEGLDKIFSMLKEKHGVSDRAEVMYWDDRDDNIEALKAAGFDAQKYTAYADFKKVMVEKGFAL